MGALGALSALASVTLVVALVVAPVVGVAADGDAGRSPAEVRGFRPLLDVASPRPEFALSGTLARCVGRPALVCPATPPCPVTTPRPVTTPGPLTTVPPAPSASRRTRWRPPPAPTGRPVVEAPAERLAGPPSGAPSARRATEDGSGRSAPKRPESRASGPVTCAASAARTTSRSASTDTSRGLASPDGVRSSDDPTERERAASGRASRGVGSPLEGLAVDPEGVGSATSPAGRGVGDGGIERAASDRAPSEVGRADAVARSGFVGLGVPVLLAGSVAR